MRRWQLADASVGALLRDGAARLAAKGIETARLDSEVLLAHCLSTARLNLLSDNERMAGTAVATRFESYLARRELNEPVAYIIGSAEFWSLTLSITPEVLIPRPDSEILVEAALDWLPEASAQAVVDLGTGSGCLSLALLSERSAVTALGIDISEKALGVASGNAAALGLADRFAVQHVSMDIWLNSRNKTDLIISNPPYIARRVYEGLDPNVRDFEPKGALVGGEDGLDFYRMIAAQGPARLNNGGAILVEIGYDQGETVAALFAQTFQQVSCRKDLAGRNRVIIASAAIG